MHRSSILVTGAAGFIGSALVGALLARGYDVTAVDEDSLGLKRLASIDSGHLRIQRTDITNFADVADIMARTNPAAVVHLAALHVIPVCETQPRRTVDVNVTGLINVLQAADTSSTERVIFASSADVYAASDKPLAESDPARPSTVYGASKLLGERLVSEWGSPPERRTTSIRIFNVYGPGDRNPHVIPDVLRHIRQGVPIRVGNTEASRDFIYVDDVVDILCRVLELDEPPSVLNAGTGSATTVRQLLDLIQGLIGYSLPWMSDATKFRPNDRSYLQADTSMLRSILPEVDPRGLDAGLRHLLVADGVLLDGHPRA
jgi:UDP-glucose 4-epimerase